ncbi:MAG: hypothetical protein PHX47_01795 [Candidatus ainarchaeum sp.]|nr:hypothetical protein [Candidatus ainarchaeum sp.]
MVSKNIKISTKKKFKPNVKRYKTFLSKKSGEIDIKYLKEQTNLDILDSRLRVLYSNGRFKDAEKAKKITKKYMNLIKISNDIFLSKSKEILTSKFIYSEPNFKEKYHDAFINDYIKDIKQLSRKGLKIEFIEEIEPILNSFIEKIEKKYKPKDPKLN